MQLVVPQKHFGARGFFMALLTVNIFVTVAIDIYAPALPGMQRSFGVTAGYLNLTMFAYFLFSAVGVFFAGPIADLKGSRPVSCAGAILFMAGSFLCAASPSVELLTLARILQAIGYGFVLTMITVMVKDSYAGKDLKTAMTMLQSLILIGPVAAPFVGTFILTVTTWRGIFVFLGVLGAVNTVLFFLMQETHAGSLPSVRAKALAKGSGSADALAGQPQPADASDSEWAHSPAAPTLGQSMGSMMQGMKQLLRQRKFVSLALLMGVAGAPYFAFIAVVSYVLLDYFGTSYGIYNLVYAVSCLITLVAPFVYSFMSERAGSNRVLVFCMALAGLSVALLAVCGHAGPWLFLLAFAPALLCEGIVRPLAFVDLLDNQPSERVGAASSLANMSYSVITSLATVLATLPWTTFVFGLDVITAGALVIMAGLFVFGITRPERL